MAKLESRFHRERDVRKHTAQLGHDALCNRRVKRVAPDDRVGGRVIDQSAVGADRYGTCADQVTERPDRPRRSCRNEHNGYTRGVDFPEQQLCPSRDSRRVEPQRPVYVANNKPKREVCDSHVKSMPDRSRRATTPAPPTLGERTPPYRYRARTERR